MKKVFLIMLIGMLVASSFVFTSCSKKENVIKIGAILPLSGPGAPYGLAEKEGIELAVEEINKNTINNKIIVLFEDTKTEPATGVTVFNKLTQIDNVNIVIGALASSVTLAICPIAEKNHIILITPGSSSPDISNAGDYIFRMYPSDDYQGRILAKWAIENNKNNIAILYLNNDFGVGLKNKFITEYENEERKIILEVPYDMGERNFRSYLTKLNKKNIEDIFIVAAGEENASILIQAKQLGLKKKFFAPDAFKNENTLKIAGNAAEGVVCTAPKFNLEDDIEITRKFIKDYESKYTEKPNVFAAYGYTTLKIISKLVNKYGDNIENIKNALYDYKANEVIGEIEFDGNGDLVPSIGFYIVKDGKFIEYK